MPAAMLAFATAKVYIGRMVETRRILCGMYAFSESLRAAWRDVFDRFTCGGAGTDPVAAELVFGPLDPVARDDLLFGHTCGYPLLKTHRGAYSAFCVPVFDVEGTIGKLYSSRLIVPAGSGIESVSECRDQVAAVNGYDSNSGMNLLRYELARAGASPGYFSQVKITGSHLGSLEAVAANEAQLAAIDCVSFQLIADENPALADAVDCIGFTARCCGLPFVLARDRDTPELRADLLDGLRQALAGASSEARERLHLRAFEAVDDSAYASIVDLENYAISKGYTELN